jgi:hypothetical protein
MASGIRSFQFVERKRAGWRVDPILSSETGT